MRLIDSKYHIEGDKIIKSTTGEEIPLDEPLFILRAKDRLALSTLKIYLELCKIDNCSYYQIRGIEDIIKRFDVFKDENPSKMKQPGITLGK